MNLDTKTKIQLYFLPLFIAYLIFYFYEIYFDTKNLTSNNIVKLEKKRYKGNYIELFSKIENFSKSKNINILNISKDKNKLKLTIKSSLSNSSYLLDYLENLNAFTKIEKISLSKLNKQNHYLYEVEISLNKYYKKELKKFKLFENKELNKFKIKAIIGDFVLIDNKLFKKGQKIGEYTILSVKRNYIELKNKSKIIKLELFNDKLAKEIY